MSARTWESAMIDGNQVMLTAVSLTTGIVLAIKILLIITGITIRTGSEDTIRAMHITHTHIVYEEHLCVKYLYLVVNVVYSVRFHYLNCWYEN